MIVEVQTPLQTAKDAVRKLFTVMNITQVIVVDDVLSTPSSIDTVAGQCIALVNAGKVADLQPLEEFSGLDLDIDAIHAPVGDHMQFRNEAAARQPDPDLRHSRCLRPQLAETGL